VLTSQSSQETTGDLMPSGVPGTTSNTPAPPAAKAATPPTNATDSTQPGTQTTQSSQGIRTDTKTFAVSKTTHRVLEPAGRIRRIASAILVDDAIETNTDSSGKMQEARRKRTPEEMKQIESLAKAAVGFETQRGDQFSLQNVSFVVPALEQPVPPGKMQKIASYVERWTGLLRYAGLVALFAVVYLLLLHPVKKQVLQILEHPGAGALSAGTVTPGIATALPAAMVGGIPDAAPGLPEVTEAVALKKELVARVKEDPAAAGRVIENWMREV
jgi:flagellar M-ring protein FliF